MGFVRVRQALAVAAAVVIGAFAVAQSPEDVEFPRFVEIGTAGTGGAYYPIGIAMAELLTAQFDTQATAQVTGGAVENIQLIQDGSVKIALTNSASAFRGRNGIEPFMAAHERVLGVFSNLTQGVFHIAAREGSGIETLEDLQGMRVSLGPAGGLGVELSGYVFEAAGFSIDDVRATFLSYDESAQMMVDGSLDAVVIQTALPNPALRQLEALGRGFNIIPLPEDVIEEVTSEHPYFDRFVIPADMYGTDSDVPTLNGTNMVVADAELPEDVVYYFTKAFIENIEVIQNSHPAAARFVPENAPLMPIELHPGAERYYREAGLLE